MTTYIILAKNKYSLYRKSNIYYNNAGEKKSPVLFLYVNRKLFFKCKFNNMENYIIKINLIVEKYIF